MDRALLDSLAVMDVMEDWPYGKRSRIASDIAKRWRHFSDEELPIALEALSICHPSAVFVLVGDCLGIRTDGMIPIGVGHAASYIEQTRTVGTICSIIVRKERDPNSTRMFQKCIREAVRNRLKFAVWQPG